jgi:hypothetical protein
MHRDPFIAERMYIPQMTAVLGNTSTKIGCLSRRTLRLIIYPIRDHIPELVSTANRTVIVYIAFLPSVLHGFIQR